MNHLISLGCLILAIWVSSAPAQETAAEPITESDAVEAASEPPPAKTVEQKQTPTQDRLCADFKACLKKNPGATAICVRNALHAHKMVTRKFEIETAKGLDAPLRREGFTDMIGERMTAEELPAGAILILDAHDPFKDKKPACPKIYGNAYMKCDGKWHDGNDYDLKFYLRRGCRTKGIWVKKSDG